MPVDDDVEPVVPVGAVVPGVPVVPVVPGVPRLPVAPGVPELGLVARLPDGLSTVGVVAAGLAGVTVDGPPAVAPPVRGTADELPGVSTHGASGGEIAGEVAGDVVAGDVVGDDVPGWVAGCWANAKAVAESAIAVTAAPLRVLRVLGTKVILLDPSTIGSIDAVHDPC